MKALILSRVLFQDRFCRIPCLLLPTSSHSVLMDEKRSFECCQIIFCQGQSKFLCMSPQVILGHVFSLDAIVALKHGNNFRRLGDSKFISPLWVLQMLYKLCHITPAFGYNRLLGWTRSGLTFLSVFYTILFNPLECHHGTYTKYRDIRLMIWQFNRSDSFDFPNQTQFTFLKISERLSSAVTRIQIDAPHVLITGCRE